MPGPCFYCLNEQVSISICLGCRSRLEAAEREIRRLKKDLEFVRLRRARKFRAYKRKLAAKRSSGGKP